MAYIDNNLMSGEEITYRAKLHWIVFLWTIIWFVVATAIVTGGGVAAIGGIFGLLGIVTGVSAAINYSTSEFGITNKRVMVKIGFIRRNSIEVLLTKVEGIQVEQGIVARILGYGSIIIGGTGGTKDPFHKIAAPLEFRRKAQEAISSAQEKIPS